MDRELEVAAAASAGGWLRWRKQHAIEPGTPCPNCETPLQGPYCFNCGQLAESFERNVIHLVVEGIESFFHFDGRFFRTLPNLAIYPGKLTRSYLDGKRAYQIPPMRLFLVVLLLVFFAGGLGLHHEQVQVKTVDQLTPQEKAEVNKALGNHLNLNVRPITSSSAPVSIEVQGDNKDPDAQAAAKAIDQGQNSEFAKWIKERAELASKDPELFGMVLESWGHRFAILMLPIAALMLSILFIFQRRFYVFDHVIFSLHSLSFQGLLLSVVFLAGGWIPYAGVLLVAAPVHLFVHMRATYQTSVIGALLRMALLFVGSVVAVLLLVTGLVWVGLSAMRPH